MSPPKPTKLTVTVKDFLIKLMHYQKEIAGYENLIKRIDARITVLKRAEQDVQTLLDLFNTFKQHLDAYKESSKIFEDAWRLYEQPLRFRGGVELELKNKDFINSDTIDRFIPLLNKEIVKRKKQLIEEEMKSFKESKRNIQNMNDIDLTDLQEQHNRKLALIEDHQQYQVADNAVESRKNNKSTKKPHSSSAENIPDYATELSEAIKAFHLQLSLLIIQFNLLDPNKWEDKRTELKFALTEATTSLKVAVPQAEQMMLAEDLESNVAMTLLFNDATLERKSRVSLALQKHLSIDEIGRLFDVDLPENISVVNTGEPQAESSHTPRVSISNHSIFPSSADQASSSSSSFDQGREVVSHLPKQALGGSHKLKIFKREENKETKETKSPRKNSDVSASLPGSVKLPGPGKKPG